MIISYKNICVVGLFLTGICAFFLGFYECGGYSKLNLIVGAILLLCVCVSVVAYSLTQHILVGVSTFKKIVKFIHFIVILIGTIIVFNVFGWLFYYSPHSFELGYEELKAALVGERCG